MQVIVLEELNKNPKMKEYLYLNSSWYKDLNRNPNNYKKFENAMKEKYKIRTTDKVNKVVEDIDLISSILSVIN